MHINGLRRKNERMREMRLCATFIVAVVAVYYCIVHRDYKWREHTVRDNIMQAARLLFAGLVSAALLLFALRLLMNVFLLPTRSVEDRTAALLPLNLNSGKVALGYETNPDYTERNYYVYEDVQDGELKYVFLEQTGDEADLGLDLKVIGAAECSILYAEDGDARIGVHYGHTEYGGFAKMLHPGPVESYMYIFIPEGSKQSISFPYEN